MKHIAIDGPSEKYTVAEASNENFEELFELYRSNREYFEYFSLEPAKERLYRDMTMLPDGCSAAQKHFLTFRRGGRPIALLDLIESYPDDDTCYIGLFMVRAELSGRGIGTDIIGELCDSLKKAGFKALRLAYGKRYEKAAGFWTKNGFVPVREAELEEYGELIVAEKSLIP